MDNNFNEAKAKGWMKEVEDEFVQVNALLKQVAEECQQMPEEDDTIMIAFNDFGKKLDSTWSELNRQFKSAIEGMNQIINEIRKKVNEIKESIQDKMSKIRL